MKTCDLGIQCQQWHTLMFEGQVALDMRVVCPQDVKKMLVQRARMVCWKRWAAKHECEGLKDGVWLEPIQPVLRRKTNEVWKDKAPTCDEETGCGRRMGADKIVRHWLVGREEVQRL